MGHDLNYQHLYYFWMITREGGVARAGKALRLSHSTVSVQLHALEAFLGGKLFQRQGRRLVLTPLGTQVAAYAEDIFRTGHELVDVARGQAKGRIPLVRIGIVGTIPRAFAYELVRPAIAIDPDTVIHVHQDERARLFEMLAAGRLHVVIADSPAEIGSLRLHSHALGTATNLLFGTSSLAARFGADPPRSLNGAPVLLPATGLVRDGLRRWFAERSITVRVTGEFDDAGMLRTFGIRGHGLFAVRSALRTELEEAQGAVMVLPLDGVIERYYAISCERRVRHDGVAAIIANARNELVTPTPS